MFGAKQCRRVSSVRSIVLYSKENEPHTTINDTVSYCREAYSSNSSNGLTNGTVTVTLQQHVRNSGAARSLTAHILRSIFPHTSGSGLSVPYGRSGCWTRPCACCPALLPLPNSPLLLALARAELSLLTFPLPLFPPRLAPALRLFHWRRRNHAKRQQQTMRVP
jgi:hypothetical protein